ncbi:MAG TPA: hypothetical protein VII95_04780 [Terriglobales bacterium]|jgi:hypothetical protein
MRIAALVIFLSLASPVCFCLQVAPPKRAIPGPPSRNQPANLPAETSSSPATGQASNPPSQPVSGTTANPACAGKDAQEIVYNNGHVKISSWVESGNILTVPICGLSDWTKASADNNPLNLRLFLAGRSLEGSVPVLVNVPQEYLNFKLDLENADQTEKAVWVDVLNAARRAREGRIPISVGVAGRYQPFTSHAYVTLNVYPWYTALVLAVLALLLAALLLLGWKSNLLRDATSGKPASPAKSPYSLGRVQMACWFFLVVAAYLYIWMVIGGKNSLNASILGLIGISAGTGLASVFVDQQKYSDLGAQGATLEAEKNALTARIAELQAANPTPGSPQYTELQAKNARLFEVSGAIAKLPPPPQPATSLNFFKDILRDGDGISFHRFQIAVWTLVLSLVFVRGVYAQLTMPTFDATLLGLMGLSSGTYVGFKFPETPK